MKLRDGIFYIWNKQIKKHPFIIAFGMLGLVIVIVLWLAKEIISAQISIWWGEYVNGSDTPSTASSDVASLEEPEYNYAEIIKKAIDAENSFQFRLAIELYIKALTLDDVIEPINAAHINARIGSAYLDLGEVISAVKYIDEATLLIHDIDINKDNYIIFGNIFIEKCNYLVRLNDFYEAILIYHKIIGFFDQFNDLNSPARATVMNNLAEIYYKVEDIENAILYAEKAREINEAADRVSANAADTFLSLSFIYSDINPTKAMEYGKNAYNIYESNLPESSASMISACQSLSNLYYDINTSKSYDYALRRYELCRAIYGDVHHSTILSEVALSRYKQTTIESLALLEEARRKVEGSYDTNSVEAAIIYNNLANAYLNSYNQSQAKQLYDECLKIFRNILGENHTYVASVYYDLALYYKDNSDYLKQGQYAEMAQTIYRNKYGEANTEVAELYEIIGEAEMLYSGDYNKALRSYEKAKAIFEDIYGTHSPSTASCYVDIAHVYILKDLRIAKQYSNSAIEIYETTWGATNWRSVKALSIDSWINYYQGNLTAAITGANKSLGIMELYSREHSPAASTALYLLSTCYFESNDMDNAIIYAKRTLETILMNSGNHINTPEFGGAYGILAKAYSCTPGMEVAAIDSVGKAIDAISNTNNVSQKAETYYDAAIVYYNLRDKDAALKYVNLCYDATIEHYGAYHNMIRLVAELRQKIEKNL